MPRKIVMPPKSPGAIEIACKFSRTKARNILNDYRHLGTIPVRDFLKAAVWIGGRYIRWQKQTKFAATNAQQIAALDKIVQLSISLVEQLDTLNDESEFSLRSAYSQRVLDDQEAMEQFTNSLPRETEALRNLQMNAQRALTLVKASGKRRTPSSHGSIVRSSDAELSNLINFLADSYESVFGRKVTHTVDRVGAYTGKPTSGSGRLILRVAKEIEPNVIPQRVATLLRQRIHRAGRKPSKASQAQS